MFGAERMKSGAGFPFCAIFGIVEEARSAVILGWHRADNLSSLLWLSLRDISPLTPLDGAPYGRRQCMRRP